MSEPSRKRPDSHKALSLRIGNEHGDDFIEVCLDAAGQHTTYRALVGSLSATNVAKKLRHIADHLEMVS